MRLMTDTSLQTLLTAIMPDDNLGVLLAAQMGGTPQEVQLIVQTAIIDDEHESIQTTGQYILRAIGVQEHRISLGLFANIAHATENALLDNYNSAPMQVHFSGAPTAIDPLLIDINQLYAQTYGMYDPFRRMVDELNPTAPLATTLTSGEGVLGVMAAPFAERMKTVLEKNGLTAHLETHPVETDDHHHDITHELLVMDDSYVVAQLFSVDPMGKS